MQRLAVILIPDTGQTVGQLDEFELIFRHAPSLGNGAGGRERFLQSRHAGVASSVSIDSTRRSLKWPCG